MNSPNSPPPPSFSPHQAHMRHELLAWNEEISPLLILTVPLSSYQKISRAQGRDLNSFIVLMKTFADAFLIILFGAQKGSG